MIFDKANLEKRTDVVSVDMSQADLEELQDLIARHNSSLQDPVVQDAWQQYRTVLRLRGHQWKAYACPVGHNTKPGTHSHENAFICSGVLHKALNPKAKVQEMHL